MARALRWGEIDIGDVDAYRDTELVTSYFVETSAFEDAAHNGTNFILGRKGSGKSATAVRLQLVGTTRFAKVIVLTNADVYRLLAQALRDEWVTETTDRLGEQLAFFFREAWYHTLLTQLMLAVHDDSTLYTGDMAQVSQYLTANNFLQERNPFRRIVNAARRAVDALSPFK